MEPAGPVVRLWGKTSDEKNVLVLDRKFRPYIYVQPRDGLSVRQASALAERLAGLSVEGSKPLSVSGEKRKHYGRETEVLKIEMKNPGDVWKFRDAVKGWDEVKDVHEFDITFYKRYLINCGLVPMAWAHVSGKEEKTGFAVDLAVDASEIRPAAGEEYPELKMLALDIEMATENGEEKIIMASLRSRDVAKVVTYRKVKVAGAEMAGSERELIEKLAHEIVSADPDIIVSYNGDRFDFMRLQERAVKFGLKFRIGRDGDAYSFVRRGRNYAAQAAGRVHVDIYNVVENMLSSSLSSEVLSLDAVSREILGEGKYPLDYEFIEKAWKEGTGLAKVAKYCLRDSYLAMKLGEGLLPQAFELCRVTGQTLFDASRSTYSQFVEWLLARKAFEAGEIIPRRPPQKEVELRRKAAPYEGGYVHPPKEGMHEDIALFDFRGLYPSIIITRNVSPETLDCVCCGGNCGKNMVPGGGHYFCTEKRGFVTSVVDDIVRKRQQARKGMERVKRGSAEYVHMDNIQKALKILANASYGYYSYPASRWYSRVCAIAIAAWGRQYIQELMERAAKEGLEVIYGDTDSLFVKEKSMKKIKAFLELVNSELPKPMELEFKGHYASGIFTLTRTGKAAKKRYALIDADGRMTVRGFERVRRDWSGISKETQEKVLLAVLKERSPKKAVEIVKGIVSELQSGKVDIKKLVIYTQLTKPISEYEQTGPHVEAARKMVERGVPAGEGSVIQYIIVKGAGSISSRAEPAEDAKDYDPDYYINNQVIPAAMRILSALGYREEDIAGKVEKDQSSLDNFFPAGKKRNRRR